MKVKATAVIAAIFIIFLCFVQLPRAKADEAKTFVGTIQSFPHGSSQFKSGPPLWPFGMIVVAADNGEKNNFLIVGDGPNATTFYDIDGKSGTVGHIQVKIGQRVEVKYAITEQSMRYLNKELAVSVRYISADYVPQAATQTVSAPIVQETPVRSENIFVGKIEKDGPAFMYFWKFTAVADNGEKKEFYVPRGGTTIIQIDGKQRYGEAPRKGRKIEIKYVVTEGGENKTVWMRYVPLDYVQQPGVSSVPVNASSETTQPVQERTSQPGNSITGRVESVKKMLPRPPYWRLALLTVVGDSGETRSIDIVNDTAVADASGKDMGKGRGAWHLKNGERVEIKYSPAANNDHDKAVSIHCLY